MTATCTHRRLVPADLDPVVALVTDVVTDMWDGHPEHQRRTVDPARWRRILTDRTVTGTHRHDGTLVAVGALDLDGPAATLGTLFVAERRQGHGRHLTALRLTQARDAGATVARAHVPSWNRPSLANLAPFGFAIVDTAGDGWDPGGTLYTLQVDL